MAKLNTRPQMVEVKRAVKNMWITRSQSRYHVRHITVELAEPIPVKRDGYTELVTMFCSCDGFGQHGHCWHVEEAVADE